VVIIKMPFSYLCTWAFNEVVFRNPVFFLFVFLYEKEGGFGIRKRIICRLVPNDVSRTGLTFSNRPLGNVLAKLQRWLVKSIEVNCSHCWGFRNQAIEVKIPGELGQNYCRWFPLWIEKEVGVVDEWTRLNADFCNELAACSLGNYREIYVKTIRNS
jgi:hypothetical protein